MAHRRFESYAPHVATRKIHIELDEDLVSRARDRVSRRDRPDSEVIADAVAAFLGFAALDEAHTQHGLSEDEANDLAVAEVRAHRADHGRAA